MLKIKTLQHPLLTENVLKVLTNSRITTILDFLNEDVEKICNSTKLSITQVLTLRNYIFEKYSAPVIDGFTLLKNSNLKKFIDTGLESLNMILNGGLPVGFITELCGLANSGKTQLCLQLAINCVKDTENTVLYIDTKGDFSATRIQKILVAYKKSYKEMAEIMFKIKVVRIFSMEELIELLQSIKNGILVLNKLLLIIIDSLPCLMFQHLGDENKIGLAFLNTFVNYCRFICKELQLGIVCVNIQTRWVDQDLSELEDEKEQYLSTFRESSYVEKQTRCLGKYWQQIPSIVLLLEKHQPYAEEDESTAVPLKISILRSNTNVLKHCILKLSSTGISYV